MAIEVGYFCHERAKAHNLFRLFLGIMEPMLKESGYFFWRTEAGRKAAHEIPRLASFPTRFVR